MSDSVQSVKNFFDNFFIQEVSFPSNQVDATVGFFLKRNFDITSARTTAIVLLNQARIDNVNVFELLDTLKTINDVQLSQIVTEILNSSRDKTSLLGYRIETNENTYDSRNIMV